MTSAFIGVTVLVTLHSLWVRRDTWWSRWEIGVSLAIALEACSVALMSPWASETLGPWLHRSVGIWNLQQLVGHILFVIAIAATTYHVLLRVTSPERARPWFRRQVILPIQLGSVAMAVLFITAGGEYQPDGFSTGDGNPRQDAYWVLLSGLIFYLSARVLRLLLVARTDPRAKETVELYTVAMAFGLTSLLVQLASIWINPNVSVLAWLFVCASVIVFAYGSARSWRAKAAWFTAHKNEFTQSPPPQALS